MEIILHSIAKLDKPPYMETIIGGPVDYEQVAPIFAFYEVALEIAGTKILLETEIRNFGGGPGDIGVDWDSDTFYDLFYSHLKIKGVNEVQHLISSNVWLVHSNERIDLPISLMVDPSWIAKSHNRSDNVR
ncbi:hypothetical protein LJ737_15930 [Hymenobacter sp. 15J16-1T3B]|uniref:hypothetical protein n=1 Tax=Hymenobacter sp. 15J16-1T3B TaxID=2886941 RepID=UPI001D12C88A|nr:hypothetical protein [Hymenobacter sp. 15J16-1T3B]MCC3158734.1 hypothetical protein [Hymenobacter sp. 15J16-1T3B]